MLLKIKRRTLLSILFFICKYKKAFVADSASVSFDM